MRGIVVVLVLLAATAVVPGAAEAGQPCTTPPKQPVHAILWAVGCNVEPLVPECDVAGVC